MDRRDCDIAIVGGGLAGGLIALALARQRPELTVRLFEAGPMPGAPKRWSWFATDLSPDGAALMAGLSTTRWDDGYDVHFPAYRRHLRTPYESLSSDDFAADLARLLPEGTVCANTRVAALDQAGVTFERGERVSARAVIDCRGFVPSRQLNGGWQVFRGSRIHTAQPHGLKRPMLMDATVGQTSAFRFVYLLPFTDNELLIEDTYYQSRSSLDDAALERRLARYLGRRRWTFETLAVERGMLPVIAGGDFEAWQGEQRIEGVARAGSRAGFAHPLTGYTLPFAVETALAVARAADLGGTELAALLEKRAREHWRRTRIYRRLASLLLGSSRASRWWKVFQRFYSLPRPLIERFYAARSTRGDRLRIVCGKPPVSPVRALWALVTRRPSLWQGA